ncbi:hypothetical protein G0U57_015107 [Chelydra serpentina]|uniref:Uncharacterized protein n=1 Tax=Chelydra serpentina TaxID=8475 RepID=A0A8T1S960_CHESE|nr:hypothetical protein G0U57_015107 [Chelydra serpentina]
MLRRPPDTGHLRLSTGSSHLAKPSCTPRQNGGERAEQGTGGCQLQREPCPCCYGQDLHALPTHCPTPGWVLRDGENIYTSGQQHTKAAVSNLLQLPWPYERHSQAKAIWRFLGADPVLAREVLHILLYDSPERGGANVRETQDGSCLQPDRLPPATTRGL